METNNHDTAITWVGISRNGSDMGKAWYIEANPFSHITLENENEIATEILDIIDTMEAWVNNYVTFSIR